jgi:nucleotide-binding universal stress UspA family protein
MIKDAIVNLAVGRPKDVAAEYAISLAAEFGAHLSAIAFAYEPVIPGTVFGGIPTEYIEETRAENEKAAKAALARFEEGARRAGISAESHVLDVTLAGGSDLFGSLARRFDLAVVAQADPDQAGLDDMVTEAALFAAGRPLIVVPYIQKEGIKLDRVLVCWDGSRNAARAIGDAMPFLVRAKTVEVIIVSTEPAKSGELPGADMGEHLARHGLTVEVKQIVAADNDVASTILSHAADFSADFLVMGGYGHSRLKEFILGGVTRGILDAMTVPVLMSH